MKPYYRDESAGIDIYCGDCRELFDSIPRVDFVLTDPPYEMVAKGGGIGRCRDYLHDIEGFTDGGFDVSILQRFDNWACFCSKTQLPKLLAATMDRRWMLVTWNKPDPCPLVNANYLPDTEYAVHAWKPGRLFGGYRDRSRFIVHPANRGGVHPNQKPLPVVAKMLRLGCDVGDTVLDPFCGSGTTLVAAKQLGCRAIGIEIEERYCEIAAKRLEQGVLDFSAAGEMPLIGDRMEAKP